MSAFIDERRSDFGVEPICQTLGVSASAYYERRSGRRSARAIEDERLLEVIRTTHKRNYSAYGYRRTWKAMLRAGEQVPPRKVCSGCPPNSVPSPQNVSNCSARMVPAAAKGATLSA